MWIQFHVDFFGQHSDASIIGMSQNSRFEVRCHKERHFLNKNSMEYVAGNFLKLCVTKTVMKSSKKSLKNTWMCFIVTALRFGVYPLSQWEPWHSGCPVCGWAAIVNHPPMISSSACRPLPYPVPSQSWHCSFNTDTVSVWSSTSRKSVGSEPHADFRNQLCVY